MKNLITSVFFTILFITLGLNAQDTLVEVDGIIKAKQLHLYDSNGDLRFKMDADSGLFEMIADDTTWYSIKVQSQSFIETLLNNGGTVETGGEVEVDGADYWTNTFKDKFGKIRRKYFFRTSDNDPSKPFEIEEHYNENGIKIETFRKFDDGYTYFTFCDPGGNDRHSSSGSLDDSTETFRDDMGNIELECEITKDDFRVCDGAATCAVIEPTQITVDTLCVNSLIKVPAIISNGGPLLIIGDVLITGDLSKFSGSFRIDHPQDPYDKYLYHSFVESPDMMNVYNGNITTNKKGKAIVQLPDYFEALNIDFRYQLTVIGAFAQAIISKEVTNNQFEIMTEKPNVKVSWQVTGIRNDAYARDNRIQVETYKEKSKRGTLLYKPDKTIHSED